ncbi:hypothetical protein KIL84_017885 [Mauremys mutica]|uniref:Uncharacterized protein n=1 Tax=Mauremys mutica TaxID=74926 RepID=A0A9D4AZ14_9SAUR|nr:hypothetical protein KIL84_017885 [Mauremys mutica]
MAQSFYFSKCGSSLKSDYMKMASFYSMTPSYQRKSGKFAALNDKNSFVYYPLLPFAVQGQHRYHGIRGIDRGSPNWTSASATAGPGPSPLPAPGLKRGERAASPTGSGARGSAAGCRRGPHWVRQGPAKPRLPALGPHRLSPAAPLSRRSLAP